MFLIRRLFVQNHVNPATKLSTNSLVDICNEFKQLRGGSIELEKDDTSGIAHIFINHQEKRNALSGKMMVDLYDIVNDLEQWSNGKGVLLHSFGSVFCSGADLETIKYLLKSEQGGFQMATLMHSILTKFRHLPLVTVALINGRAMGGGAELCTMFDYRLMTLNSSIQFVQGRMGLSPGWSGGLRLKQIIGSKNTLDLLLTSKQIKAKEALEMKLIDHIFEDDKEVIEQAVNWLKTKIIFDVSVVRTMKKLMMNIDEETKQLENEKKLFLSLWGGKTNLEAIQSNVKHQ
ncbi:unnamed protein product [Didymodactylos carnosus]|uniref:Ethylmalonyl-CoA decarboxylase n=1 Tax=Didymodactylos carnosus TaxID=1234261 RepID=A0A813NX17_9BILA|nr:unnamed protein product [Didymodactylos carnosus]CAF0784335.1 unnamed protein product [Didymodactylos carnosus]CAF3518361.1 unnamed protein product [Didymodactylos carnosus]CAF3566395.1 unnamed protein product [Didymodactylos carnosus]